VIIREDFYCCNLCFEKYYQYTIVLHRFCNLFFFQKQILRGFVLFIAFIVLFITFLIFDFTIFFFKEISFFF